MKTRFYVVAIILLTLSLSSCTETLLGDAGAYDQNIYLNYETKTQLELPFEEEWYLTAGGRTHNVNGGHFYARESGQRYAYDIIKVVDSTAYSGNGGTNEDTYTFGARLNAPASGVIVSMENDIDDNTKPGVVNSDIDNSNLGGNYIIIDHLNGEYSFLAHFKKGTITVSVGDAVIQGQEVGKAGNSGNSTGPHLHYHLQNTPHYLDGLGYPAQFNNYKMKEVTYPDDELVISQEVIVTKGEPIRGQLISKN